MSNSALQIDLNTASTIAASTNVLFDTEVYSSGSITYNSATGVITFSVAGRYVIDWWLAMYSSQLINETAFALVSSQGDYIKSSIIDNSDKVLGVGIVDVITAPVTLSLVNVSTRTIYFSFISSQKGTLVITEDSEGSSGLTNLVDGNTIGSVRGIGTKADYTMGRYAFAEGHETTANGNYSHAEGSNTVASRDSSHAEGWDTTASGFRSHAEGGDTTASGNYSHAEGVQTVASGDYAHAEGASTVASANFSHAEGASTRASYYYAHAEGANTVSRGNCSHAEGDNAIASGASAHAEGTHTTASGDSSHAEGGGTTANGSWSHTEGKNTSANMYEGAHIMGKYGEADNEYSWHLANGIDSNNKGLAAKILSDGNAYIDVAWNTGGADYAELFETVDGKTIEPGYFVTFDGAGQKIRKSTKSDSYILGVVTKVSGFVGDSGELRWKGKYLTDEWGEIQYHEVTVPEKRDDKGNVLLPEHTEIQPILNPEWDNTKKYIPRLKRPEWVTVGLLGKIRVRDDGTCVPGGYCRPSDIGIATTSESGYRVLERLSENRILILYVKSN